MFRIYRNCCFPIARIAKMLYAVRIATLACSFTFICHEKNGVSEAYFTNSANEC